ncbi:MAG: anaerobic ribonucleoside-triphosphate reductase [Candidatus Odinarchaeota archaeon]
MDLLPKVFRTEGSITEFDPSKIFESIIKETGMSESDAKNITELVVRRIISSGIKFLSGPHIREIVCSILSEQHFENERKLYTRIGMPLMDYEELLEKKSETTLNIQINPEKINHWSANQIAEEYTHLRILSNEESKAHLYGDIHINGLSYFDLRPFTQMWDPRLILSNGFPPFNSLKNPFKQEPPKDIISAFSQYLKWFETVQNEFYGTQGLNLFTLFLAPYITNLSKEKLKQEIRKLISELNLLPIITGRDIPSITITSSNSILESFSKLPTINPNDKINDTYSDYHNECIKLFKTLIYIFGEISKYNIYCPITKFQILLTNKFFEVIEMNHSNFWDDIYTFKNLSSIDFCFDSYFNKNLEKIAKNRFCNFGILQNISLNLPRYAYNSKDEDIFLEELHSKVKLCSEILLKKYKIIEKRLKLKHLPCCSSNINNEPLFKLENQDLSFSLVGLNESIKILTNYELHQNSNAVKLAMRILNELNNICNELTETNRKSFVLSENVSKRAIKRFTELDIRIFKKGITQISKNLNYEYTNSIHFRNEAEIELFKRMEIQGVFQQYIKNGAIEHISLYNLEENNLTIQEFLKIIGEKSRISSINFSS